MKDQNVPVISSSANWTKSRWICLTSVTCGWSLSNRRIPTIQQFSTSQTCFHPTRITPLICYLARLWSRARRLMARISAWVILNTLDLGLMESTAWRRFIISLIRGICRCVETTSWSLLGTCLGESWIWFIGTLILHMRVWTWLEMVILRFRNLCSLLDVKEYFRVLIWDNLICLSLLKQMLRSFVDYQTFGRLLKFRIEVKMELLLQMGPKLGLFWVSRFRISRKLSFLIYAMQLSY